LWRFAVSRRNKSAWSSFGLGLSLGDILGKYGASLRERERESSEAASVAIVYGTHYVDMETLSFFCATLGEGAL
jgi:hypothetical protein